MPSLWILTLLTLAMAAAVAVAGIIIRLRQRTGAEAALSTAVKRADHQEDSAKVEPDASTWRRWVSRLEKLGHTLEGSKLKSVLLADEDLVMLDQAGWGNSTGQSVYVGARITLAVLLPFLALLLLETTGLHQLIMLAVAAALGILLPKLLLRSRVKRIRKSVHDELPLFIDLLRLLQSVGFSMDQSLQMLGDKLKTALPVIGHELEIANLAYSRGRSREASLQRLGESFANPDLNALIQMVVQVHSHGGAVQEPLKQFGNRLREKRRMEMKEKIGKLSVKMTVVMMATLLPALLLVLAGPAVVSLAGSLSAMGES